MTTNSRWTKCDPSVARHPTAARSRDLSIQITQRRPGYLDEQRSGEGEQALHGRGPSAHRTESGDFWYRGGVTLILDLESFEVRYAIYKDIVDTERLDRQRDYMVRSTRPLAP